MRTFPSLSGAGVGRSLAHRSPHPQGWRGKGGTRTPPGEGLGANAAGRLPRSPSPRPPPAPPAASVAARRSSAVVPAQSVSPRRWVSGGRSDRGWGMRGGGMPKGEGHVQDSPTPPLPRLPGILPPGAQGVGAPRRKRAELSRVLTSEWPARRSLASSVSERPLQEGPLTPRSSSAGRIEVGAQGERWGEVQGGSPRQVSQVELYVLPILVTGGSLQDSRIFYHPQFQVFQPGGATLRVAGKKGQWKISLARCISLPPPR